MIIHSGLQPRTQVGPGVIHTEDEVRALLPKQVLYEPLG